jgi:hypothetical protein
MFLMSDKQFPIMPVAIYTTLLNNLTISPTQPGAIIHNMDAFLNAVAEKPIELTATGMLSGNRLAAINARLHESVPIVGARLRQSNYPHIEALYLVARAAGLVTTNDVGKKTVLAVDEGMIADWRTLNDTERYCSLLYAWLVWGDAEAIGVQRAAYQQPGTMNRFAELLAFLAEIPETGMHLRKESQYLFYTQYEPAGRGFAVMQMFGLVECKTCDAPPGNTWCIESVYRTQIGIALFSALIMGLGNLVQDESDDLDQPVTAREGLQIVFMRALQSALPAWQRSLKVNTPTFAAGVYTFRLTVSETVWRQIAIDTSATFEDLAMTILYSIHFDDEHLYDFEIVDRFGTIETYAHPFASDGYSAADVQLGDVGLTPGQIIDFTYDFGDMWEFKLLVEAHDPDKTLDAPKIVGKAGRAPKQYRSGGDMF